MSIKVKVKATDEVREELCDIDLSCDDDYVTIELLGRKVSISADLLARSLKAVAPAQFDGGAK